MQGELTSINIYGVSIGISGIYCNENDTQEGVIVFLHHIPCALALRHHVINQFDWSAWKTISDLTKVDPYLLGELIQDGYDFDFKEGGQI